MTGVPEGSLYLWCYTQGLKGVSREELIASVEAAGRSLREKDLQNWFNGFRKRDLNTRESEHLWDRAAPRIQVKPWDTRYTGYPKLPVPYDLFESEERFVPCNADNKPMIKWGNGCMSRADARAWTGARYLAENMKGGRLLVIDCDGDHGAGDGELSLDEALEQLDLDTVDFLCRYRSLTHCLMKPKLVAHYCKLLGEEPIGWQPASFHLTFRIDRVIPTMHFPKAHIDIIGNKENSLRYFKTKIWNHVQPIDMTDEIWGDIMGYIKERER